MRLGTLTLDVPFFQASLSGYSDYAMRTLARRFGCPFALADVMLAKSVTQPHVLRKACFRPGPDEHPVGAQLLGATPATMAQAARDLLAAGYDVIDVNAACPAPKVLRRGRGGALLGEPDRLIAIVAAVRDAVASPLLLKLRIGLDHGARAQDNFWEIMTRSVAAGVDAFVIHGRTVSQRFRGKADWAAVATVKRRFPTATIIGSGDVFEPHATIELMKSTGLDGFVVARGAIGNPWIFRDLRRLWENRPVPPPPDVAEQRLIMLEHLERVLRGFPEKQGVHYWRKFALHYARRHPQRKQVVLALIQANTRREVEVALDVWYADSRPGV